MDNPDELVVLRYKPYPGEKQRHYVGEPGCWVVSDLKRVMIRTRKEFLETVLEPAWSHLEMVPVSELEAQGHALSIGIKMAKKKRYEFTGCVTITVRTVVYAKDEAEARKLIKDRGNTSGLVERGHETEEWVTSEELDGEVQNQTLVFSQGDDHDDHDDENSE